MKKSLIMLVALAATAATPSFAQTAPATTTHLPTHRVMRLKPGKSPEQHAEQRTSKLTKTLGLSTAQQSQVQQLMLAQAQADQTLKTKYPSDDQRQALHQEMKASHAKYKAQLQGVLSADQNAKLTAMQHAHKGEHGGKKKLKS